MVFACDCSTILCLFSMIFSIYDSWLACLMNFLVFFYPFSFSFLLLILLTILLIYPTSSSATPYNRQYLLIKCFNSLIGTPIMHIICAVLTSWLKTACDYWAADNEEFINVECNEMSTIGSQNDIVKRRELLWRG